MSLMEFLLVELGLSLNWIFSRLGMRFLGLSLIH